MSITKITLENTSESVQPNVPFTFGQVFSQGDLPVGMGLEGFQVDAKAHHPDGSVRHAVLSAVTELPVGGKVIDLVVAESTAIRASLNKELPTVDAEVVIVLDGEQLSAKYTPNENVGLDGPVVAECHSISSFVKADGSVHPHLHARFAVRSYHGTSNARVDISVENNWAYEPAPQNFTYDAAIIVGGQIVYEKKALTHRHHSRWRKMFWTAEAPQVNIQHDASYLVNTRAIPNYDLTVKPAEKLIAKYVAEWTGEKIEPMGIGLAQASMPAPGAHRDIGFLPEWAVSHLLSMDKRTAKVHLGTADLAGSWTMHYRDKNKGLPISLMDYPYMTLVGTTGDTRNPATKQFEAFPKLPTGTKNTGHDSAHQPSFAYLAYLLTGDHYYLEELQFWAMYNVFQLNPGYRKNVRGLLMRGQVREQAWGLKSLGYAAYITPDNHPLKDDFANLLESNLSWYRDEYVGNPNVSKLGVITHASAVVYNIDDIQTEVIEEDNAIGVFMDDFFTSVLGQLVDMGFESARPMLEYKIRFPIERLIGEGVNWQSAATYSYRVRDNIGSPFYETIGEAFRETVGPEAAAVWDNDQAFATARKTKLGDIGNYSIFGTGFASNLQPAIAYAADYGGERGKEAWDKFMSRSVKANYTMGAQFNIIPRKTLVSTAPVEVPPVINPPVEVPPPVVTPPSEVPVEPPIEVPPVVEVPPIVIPEVPPATPPVTPAEPAPTFTLEMGDILTVTRDSVQHSVSVADLVKLVVANTPKLSGLVSVDFSGTMLVKQ